MIVTYLSPAVDYPIGGVKVLYKHVELLNSLGVESYIYHPKKHFKSARLRGWYKFFGRELDGLSGKNRSHSQTWFAHRAPLRPDGEFDPRNDFVIIPEIWAPAYAQDCLRKGIKYAIFVQGGYLLDSGLDSFGVEKVEKAYRGASLIIGISEDSIKMVRLAFPFIEDKNLIRVLPHINSVFAPAVQKENWITFMPRKMSGHALKLAFFVRHHLPKDWILKPIDGLSEPGVAAVLAKSKIFLSFCEMEGCPLPPLEAAFSGNVVVGYTGQGAKEYFVKPIFREIELGDISSFIQGISAAISEWGLSNDSVSLYEEARLQLVQTYDEFAESNSVKHLSERLKLMLIHL